MQLMDIGIIETFKNLRRHLLVESILYDYFDNNKLNVLNNVSDWTIMKCFHNRDL